MKTKIILSAALFSFAANAQMTSPPPTTGSVPGASTPTGSPDNSTGTGMPGDAMSSGPTTGNGTTHGKPHHSRSRSTTSVSPTPGSMPEAMAPHEMGTPGSTGPASPTSPAAAPTTPPSSPQSSAAAR